MKYSSLYNKTNYASEFQYHNGVIREYDLSKANISALHTRGIIDEKTYTDLYNADKHYREVVIGMMIKKDRQIYDEIQEGIKEAKRLFFQTNNIQDSEVITIHNDAVVVKAQRQMQDTFGLYHFAIKGEYTQYFRDFNRTEYYYAHDNKTNEDIFTIKGISEETLQRNEQHFAMFMINVFYMLENNRIEETIGYFNEYLAKYLNNDLTIESYRELNSDNKYRIIGKIAGQVNMVDNITKEQLPAVDKGYNYAIIRDLGRVIYDQYFIRTQSN